MSKPIGHEKRSAIHGKVLGQGVKVTRGVQLDENTTLIEYDRAEGCYLYFGNIRGPQSVKWPYEQVKEAWPDDLIELPAIPISRIELKKSR